MDIATGTPEPLPLDASGLPGVQAPTVIADYAMVQGGVRDLTGERISQLDSAESQIAAAMSSGMGIENDRRLAHQSDLLPTGADYGVPMDISGYVYDQTVPPASQDPYLNSGDEPVAGG